MTRFFPMACGVLLLACLAGGCDNPTAERAHALEMRVVELEQALATRGEKIEDLNAQLAHQQEQIRTLQTLGEKRMEFLPRVDGVEIGQHTGGLDADKQPGHELVKVFVLPRDSDGSVIKAAGSVTLQLYDLALPEDQTLLVENTIDVEDLSKHWSSGFMTYHYSFELPLPQPLQHEELTLRVAFTDYLTGRTHSAQKTISVALPTAPQNNTQTEE